MIKKLLFALAFVFFTAGTTFAGTDDFTIDLFELDGNAYLPTETTPDLGSVARSFGDFYGGALVITGITLTGDISITGDFTLDGLFVCTPSGDTSLLAATQITVTDCIMRVVGNGGAVILTGTPTIVDAADGTIVTIQGTSDTNTVKLQDEGNLSNSGLQMEGGFDFILGVGDTIKFKYDAGDDNWYEKSRSDN